MAQAKKARPIPPAPPAARRRPVATTLFGDTRVDDYAWLRRKGDPAVRAHLEAENAYAEACTRPLAGLRGRLYREMLARIQETDESVPFRHGGWWYYTREVKGLQYPIHCRRAAEPGAAEQVILDVNEIARGHAYAGVDILAVSPDGRYLAWGVDYTGYREYVVRVKDLATGRQLRDRLERVDDVAWAADGQTLFYVRQDAAKRPDRLYRHRLGARRDVLVWREADERFDLSVELTLSERWIVATAASKDTTEVRVIPADRPQAVPRRIAPRRRGHEHYVDHRGEEFWIRTNDRHANFRLVRAPVGRPSPRHWVEALAPRAGVVLEDAEVFRDFLVLHERKDGMPRLRVRELRTGRTREVAMPEPVRWLGAGVNARFDANAYRFEYESYVTPATVYDYDVATGRRTLLKRRPVRGGYDSSRYASALAMARAPDGTAVPVSLVWRRQAGRRGPRPLLLYGYGAYGHPLDAGFSIARLSLLDRGMVYAVAHVRGGGERGRAWYDAGRLANKENSFTDFIAAAEHLVAAGWTTPDRLVIEGGSAGGLLVAAAANRRPDLFRAVVAEVPFVDVLNTMLDPSLPLTTLEYLEWGDPRRARGYRSIRAWSPYENLAPRAYPAMLVEASLHDSQVPYWEAAKYVARLRAVKTDANPVLLRTQMAAGHGGASGRYDALREAAFTYAFVLDQAGLAR